MPIKLKFNPNYYEYLDRLRESGVVNMFGAGEYVETEFDVTKQEAKEIVLDWMRTFTERHPQGATK